MKRTRIVLLASVVCAAALPVFPGSPPNILLVLCDDLGYGDLACFGAKDAARVEVRRCRGQANRVARLREI